MKELMMIIVSLLDTDKYKITMMQFFFFTFNGNRKVKWKFTNRSKDFDESYHPRVLEILKYQVEMMNGLMFTEGELKFLQSKTFHPVKIIKDQFINYLRRFKLDASLVNISEDGEITVTGTHVATTLWETYILSLYNQIYTMLYAKDNNIDIETINKERIAEKLVYLKDKDFKIIEFGTRRRASKEIQAYNLKQLSDDYDHLVGTSNMLLSKEIDIKCYGTQAHESLQTSAAFAYIDGGIEALKKSQYNFIMEWNKFYEGELNIFLPDTFGTDSFLNDFKETGLYTNPLNGSRHDSGEPLAYDDKMFRFYKENLDNVSSYIITFSDGLNVESSYNIQQNVHNECVPYFGIGTSLTFDIDGIKPLSIVCKVAHVWDDKNDDWVSTVKLSDNANKAAGESKMIELYKDVFGYQNKASDNTTLVY